MSTKIYNGFYMDFASVELAIDHVKRLLPSIQDASLKALSVSFSTEYFDLLDNVYCENATDSGAVFSTLQEKIHQELIELDEGYRSASFDAGVDFSFKAYNGKVYGGIFCEKNNLEATVLDLIGATRFPYWDCTDKPKDLTDSEWDRRRAIWDDLLPRYSWEKSGFISFTAVDPRIILDNLSFDLIDLKNFSVERRAERFAYRRATYELVTEGKARDYQIKPSEYANAFASVKEGKHPNLVAKLRRYFVTHAITPTLDNFKTLSPSLN